MICTEHDEASLLENRHSLLFICSNNIDNNDYDVCKQTWTHKNQGKRPLSDMVHLSVFVLLSSYVKQLLHSLSHL